ncbi:MAG: HAD family hydrolase [Deltaproteobacteria bacterium]|nr:MAG: HAD family hydrolase [Deltaproteobacteria bacterium]
MQQPQAVSFDLDGTLATVRLRRWRLWRGVVLHPAILAGYAGVVEELRGERPADLDAAIVARLAARTGGSTDRTRQVVDEWIDRRWPAAFRHARPPRGVRALVEACDRARIPRVVVSDHPALDKLAAMGLGGWAAVVSCRALGALKPLPDGLHAAAAQLGVPVRRILHVGDRPETDGAMAAAAGAAFLDVATLARGGLPPWAALPSTSPRSWRTPPPASTMRPGPPCAPTVPTRA